MDQQKENENNENDEEQFPTDSAHRISPFIDRYFQKYYKIYEPFLPQYAFQHSNRLYMIGITAEHPIVKSNTIVQKVSFTPIGADNCKTFVKGKKKIYLRGCNKNPKRLSTSECNTL